MKKLFLPAAIIISCVVFFTTVSSCKKKSVCDNVNCNNGGTCVNGNCNCDSLHEGTNCEIEKRAKYFGSFTFQVECSSIHHLDYLKFSPSDSGAYQIIIHNLHGLEDDCTANMMADGSVVIPYQYINAYNISGSANIVNNKIVVNYILYTNGGNDTCTWTEN